MAEIGQVPGGSRPFGGIYAADTKYSDAVALGLQQEGAQLAAQGFAATDAKAKQLEEKKSDKEKEQAQIEANVRAGDQPLVHKSYNEYRDAQMNLMRDEKKLPREEYLKRKQEADIKYAQTQQLIANSIQRKTVENAYLKDINDPTKQSEYSPEASKLIQQSISTPYTQLNNYSPIGNDGKPELDETGKPKVIDFTNPENYRYKAVTPFEKVFTEAEGKQSKLNEVEVPSENGSLTKKTLQYEGKNSPINFYKKLETSLNGNIDKIPAEKVQADFNYTTRNITPQQMEETDKSYKQLVSTPEYKKAYGLKGTEDFPETANTPMGRKVKYLAQQHALLNPPISTISEKTDIDKKTAHDDAKALQKQKDANAEKRMFFNYKEAAKAGKGAQYLNDSFDAVYKGNGTQTIRKIANPDGTSTEQKTDEISAPLAFRKAFEVDVPGEKGKIIKILPDKILKLPNGNLRGYYPERDDAGFLTDKSKTGNIAERKDVTPIELDEKTARVAYARTLASGAALNGVTNKDGGKVYKYNGKDISQSAIEKAAKASGRTVQEYIKEVGIK